MNLITNITTTDLPDLARRVAKTFIAAVVAAIVTSLTVGLTSVKGLLISALAAGVTAVVNLLLPPAAGDEVVADHADGPHPVEPPADIPGILGH